MTPAQALREAEKENAVSYTDSALRHCARTTTDVRLRDLSLEVVGLRVALRRVRRLNSYTDPKRTTSGDMLIVAIVDRVITRALAQPRKQGAKRG